LDQEHHQKRDDGRAGVDNKLPSIREPEERNRPDHHGPESKGKHPSSTYFAGTDLRDFSEQLAEDPGFLGDGAAEVGAREPFFFSEVLRTGSDPISMRIRNNERLTSEFRGLCAT
jgi:hypothetical protein